MTRILNIDDGYNSSSSPSAGSISGDLSLDGSVFIKAGNFYYIGDNSTNGSWRLFVEDGKFIMEKRVSGAWTRYSEQDL
jgi:hypothetical protein